MIPAHFLPKVAPDEFICPPIAPTENRLEVGVLFVGAGPANLSGAIRLMQLLNETPDLKASLGEIPVAIVEKGKYVGAHLLAGAVFNPMALKRLFPDLKTGEFPLDIPVQKEAFYFLTKGRSFRLPVPPTMHNRGHYAVSLSRLGRWLAQEAEKLGVAIFTETSAVKLLVENQVIRGIKTGDKGRDRTGAPLPNFQEGVEIIAKVTILGEGGCGHLTQSALTHFGVGRLNPQTYSLGVKEVWEVQKPLDRVIHTMGWPLRGGRAFGEFGGSFVYPMGPKKVSLGLVVGLGYRDATLSVHDLLQEMKTHRFFKNLLEGGRRIAWGAKTIPEGGYASVPERLAFPGALIVGDSAGLLNVPAIKGIHYASTSGMLAAETIFSALRTKKSLSSMDTLSQYDTAVRQSFMMKELYAVRNMRPAFNYGLAPGVILSGLMTLTHGIFPGGIWKTKADRDEPLFIGQRSALPQDGQTIFDKLSSVYLSGNKSRDDQPNHIRVQTDVPEAVREAWIHMCPANVYEAQPRVAGSPPPADGLRLNPTNCIQCGAISAKGGQFTPPEGGSGPEYQET